MPNRFDTLWKRVAEPNMVREYAISISYNDHTRSSPLVIATALVTREEQTRRPNSIGGWDMVTVRKARFGTLTNESLRIDGDVTVDGKQYSIESIDAIEGQRTQLNLRRVEVGELTRPDYRRMG